MHVYICIYVHIYTHVYIHTYIYICIYIYTHIYTFKQMYRENSEKAPDYLLLKKMGGATSGTCHHVFVRKINIVSFIGLFCKSDL